MTNVVRVVAILLTLTAVDVGLPSSHAQQTAKIPRIGRLGAGFPVKPLDAAFSQGLREFGYVDRQNIVVEYRYAEGKSDRLAELAAALARMKVDVIVAGSGASIYAAHKATKSIPIVMAQSAVPLASGLVDSLANPGGNITGVTSYYPVSRGKIVEIFKEAIPKLRRLAVIRNPSNPGNGEGLKAMEAAARAMHVRLQLIGVQSLEQIENAFAAIINEQANGVFITNSPFIRAHATRINEFMTSRRLPTIYVDKLYVEAGGLMSYGVDIAELYRRSAFYVDQILKGVKPGDLPIERSTNFELVINLRTAKQIGVTIPPAVLMDADRVIK